MDTSETYIKMCNCEEIILQAPRLLLDYHDFWVNNPKPGIPSLHPIWLPRQDQLQEMAWDREYHEDNIHHLLMRFYHTKSSNIYYEQFASMEQLWLAFVMKEKYNKAWNGEDWVKA